MSQFPLGHLRYAMIHKIKIVPIIGTNESSDNHGDRPVRRKIRHGGTIVTVISTTPKSTEITSNTPATPIGVKCVAIRTATKIYGALAN